MREIPIDAGDDPEEVLNVLWGNMEFPESADRAFEVTVRLEVARAQVQAVPNNERITVPAAWLKALMNGHSAEELKRGGEVRGRRGVTAGLVLLSMHAASTSTKVAPLNDAIELVMQASERKLPLNTPFQLYRNKPEIHRAWKQMAPVAHLWGALCALYAIKDQLGVLSPQDRLNLICSNAVALQRWALSPADGRKPVIDAASMLMLRCAIEAPDLRLNLTDTVHPGFAEMLSRRKKGR